MGTHESAASPKAGTIPTEDNFVGAQEKTSNEMPQHTGMPVSDHTDGTFHGRAMTGGKYFNY